MNRLVKLKISALTSPNEERICQVQHARMFSPPKSKKQQKILGLVAWQGGGEFLVCVNFK